MYSFQALMQVLKNRIIKIESFTRSPSKIKGWEHYPILLSYKITRVVVLSETEFALKDAYMYAHIYIVPNREQLNKELL